MPIYEYHCKDCDSILELLLDVNAEGPRTCGFRCGLKKGVSDELRGFGSLRRRISAFNQVDSIEKDTPSPSEAAKKGLSTYQNQGDGTFKKIAGKKGPALIRR
jgi:putative FmdB family regulatory protein